MKRRAALPRWMQAGIDRAERERKVAMLTRPMRHCFEQLASGEAYELDGHIVMRMPEINEEYATQADWVRIAPAIAGWVDCWLRIAPDLPSSSMSAVADALRETGEVDPALVAMARNEFDRQVQRLIELPPEHVTSAIRTTEIAWEFEDRGMTA